MEYLLSGVPKHSRIVQLAAWQKNVKLL
jgi:hypothetical protein